MTEYIPHLHLREGDKAYVRVTVLKTCSDAFQVRIEDFPKFIITTWVPASEVAKAEDIARLNIPRRRDLKYLDPHYLSEWERQKLPK